MTDELMMNNYLLILKSTVEVYVHGTLESYNPDIKYTLKDNLNTILESQANTFEIMTKNNWYTIENVNTSAINKIYNKLNKKN